MTIEKVLRPCPHCAQEFGGRELRSHEAHCPKRAIQASVQTTADRSAERGSFTDFFRRRQDTPTELSRQQELMRVIEELRPQFRHRSFLALKTEAERILDHRMSTTA